MATIKVTCPYCGSEEVVLYGKSRTGKQRVVDAVPLNAPTATTVLSAMRLDG